MPHTKKDFLNIKVMGKKTQMTKKNRFDSTNLKKIFYIH